MTPDQISRLASAFWEKAGGPPPPPRDLEPLIPLHCGPVFVVPTHSVSRTAVRDWFRHRPNLPTPPGRDDARPALGCVIAFRGFAAIFVDDTLTPDLRRVIVAHEFGHYLAEYEWPRQRVVRRLGHTVLPVLDGDRPPTAAEAWAGTLAGVPLGVHAHYLERGFDPAGLDLHVRSERTANAMALELLAPAVEVLDEMSGEPLPRTVASILVEKYGLPPDWAGGYATRLAATAARRVPASARWGL